MAVEMKSRKSKYENINYTKIASPTNYSIRSYPHDTHDMVEKEFSKYLHTRLLQDPQQGLHPHVLDLVLLDGLALAMVNIFDKLFQYLI